MKNITFLFLTTFVFSFTKIDSKELIPCENFKLINNNSILQTGTTTWINSFRDFINAIYQNDRNKVKQFIDFPIVNDNNEIWYLAYGNNEKMISKIQAKTKPFTEQDFDKYYNKIFTKRFLTSVLKIKSSDLSKKGNAESPEFKDNTITYKMYATFDKETNKLTLNLAYKTTNRNEDGGEFNIIYEFDILNNTKIKFRQVRLAG